MRSVGQKVCSFCCFWHFPALLGSMCWPNQLLNLYICVENFNVRDATQTAEVLQLYCYLLVASSFVKVLVPSFMLLKTPGFQP